MQYPARLRGGRRVFFISNNGAALEKGRLLVGSVGEAYF